MTYVKTNWTNDAAPAINATNLNHIEQGIFDAHDLLTKRPPVTVSTFSGGPPASPADGDIWIATGAGGSASCNLTFRYFAGSASSFKWELVGGSPIFIGNTYSPPADAAWHPDTAAGITVPRAGDYFCELTGNFQKTTLNNNGVVYGVSVNGGTPGSSLAAGLSSGNWTGWFGLSWRGVITLAANDVLRASVSDGSSSVSVSYELSARPLRVS